MTLRVSRFMPLRLRVMRELHNAKAAYDDAIFRIDIRLACEHFDAIGRGDEEAALEAEQLRRDLGLSD